MPHAHPPEHRSLPAENRRGHFFGVMVIPRIACTTKHSLERFRESITGLVMADQITTLFESDAKGSPRLAIAIAAFASRKQAENAVLELNEQQLGNAAAGFPLIVKSMPKDWTDSVLHSKFATSAIRSARIKPTGFRVHDILGGIILFETELDARNAQYILAATLASIQLEGLDYFSLEEKVLRTSLRYTAGGVIDALKGGNTGNGKKKNANIRTYVRTSDSDALIMSLQETMEQTILETKVAFSAAHYPIGKILVLESRLAGQFGSLRKSMRDLKELLADIQDSDSEGSSE